MINSCENATFGLGVLVVFKRMWRGIGEAPRDSWVLYESPETLGSDAYYRDRDGSYTKKRLFLLLFASAAITATLSLWE